jgi:2'-5' RNA ligase
MGMIGLRVPEATARVLGQIPVEGEPSAHPHVTILNLGDDIPIPTLASMMVAAMEVAETYAPFTVRTSLVSSFPSEDSVPIIARVESDELHDLWGDLCTAFDQVDLDYSKKFPNYSPHVTLAWADEQPEDQRIPTIEWGAHELCIWGGNSGEGRVLIHMPFSIMNRAASTVRTRVSKQDIANILQRDRIVRRYQDRRVADRRAR